MSILNIKKEEKQGRTMIKIMMFLIKGSVQ
jgi:hypothetical protein